MNDYDRCLVNHEGAHVRLVLHEGWDLVGARVDRHSSADDDCGNVFFFRPPSASPEAVARVALAGNVFEPWPPSPKDAAQARRAWARAGSPPGWMEAREEEVRAVLRSEPAALSRIIEELIALGSCSGVRLREAAALG